MKVIYTGKCIATFQREVEVPDSLKTAEDIDRYIQEKYADEPYTDDCSDLSYFDDMPYKEDRIKEIDPVEMRENGETIKFENDEVER